MSPTPDIYRFCFWLCSWIVVVALVLISPGSVSAQDSQQQGNRNWQPPQATTPFVPPKIDNPEQWWPDEPVKRDGSLRVANHEAAVAADRPDIPSDALGNPEGWSSEMTEPGTTVPSESGWADRLKQKFAGADIQKMLGSLAVVLGGYFGFVWVWRRFSSGGMGGLPAEVLEIVGSTPFGPKKTLQLVRLGTRLLLLLNGPEGTHPIGEITDPIEVEHITSICGRRGNRSQSEKRTVFNNLVHQLQKRESSHVAPGREMPVAAPQVVASSLPHQHVATPSATNGELERILKTLTQAVRQVQHQNEFEA